MLALAITSLLGTAPAALAVPGTQAPTAEAALADLKAGNLRFAEGRRSRTLHPAVDLAQRAALAKGQHPEAVIFACSDSRVADNLVFDQELGRLFTIRVAGNCPDTLGLASAEYAVEHLGCRLLVVMGHTHCGAVAAVARAKGEPLPGNLWIFQASMAGLLESTPQKPGEDPAAYRARLAETNAVRQARIVVQRSDYLREQVRAGRLKVVPALYDLDTGRVRFLDEPAPAAP